MKHLSMKYSALPKHYTVYDVPTYITHHQIRVEKDTHTYVVESHGGPRPDEMREKGEKIKIYVISTYIR